MNNQTSTRSFESKKDNLRIQILVEKLKKKLLNFNVLDRLGYKIGNVNDVKIDSDRQLNLVISAEDNYQIPQVFLVRSNQIQQIDTANKNLFLHLSKAEVRDLPEYVMLESADIQAAQTSALTANISEPKVMEEDITIKAHEMDIVPATVNDSDDTSLEDIIHLLEERLVVKLKKRKIGEVIVRKEIHTKMVQVPVKWEKLIVEQVSPEHQQLAEIDLGHEEIGTIEQNKPAITDKSTVTGEFTSPKTASLLLDAIANRRHHGCKKIRVEIVMEDETMQKTYQQWFDRCQSNQKQ